MSVTKKAKTKDPLPPMNKLLDILVKKRFIIEDVTILLDFIDISELASEDEDNSNTLNERTGETSSDDDDSDACTDDAKSFALTLFYHSAEAYDYVRTHYKTCLPPVPIISPWYVHSGGLPGFCQETLQAIKSKVQASQEKIFCSLAFKKFPDFSVGCQYVDGQGYFGFEDFGAKIETDCQDKANDAIFFIASDINGTWSLPVGYFLLNYNSDKFARIIKIAIYLLEKSGVNVVALSYDNSCINAVELLGCQLKQKKCKTIFQVNTNKDICAFPDYNGLREDICQQLSWFKEFTDSDGNTIAWKYIMQLDKKDKDGSKEGNEQITDEDKRVQTRAVASRLKHHKELKSPSFAGVDGTITFIDNLNDLMDIFNSEENCTALKQAIADDNKAAVIEKMDKLIQYFMGIKCKHPVNFTGFAIAAKSVKELVRLCLRENCLKCIPTQKLSMAAVERMFGAIKRYAQVRDVRAYKLHLAYKQFLIETC